MYKTWSLYKFEKKSLFVQGEFWVFKNIVDKLSSIDKLLAPNLTKKCCHIGILEGVVIWSLASITKVEQTNFCSPPILLLESFVCLIDGLSVEHPLV